jgi:hypothetical protein
MIVGLSGAVVFLGSAAIALIGVFGGAALLVAQCPCGCIGCLGPPLGYGGAGLSAILALVALPLGFFGMSRGGKGMAITGIVSGGVTIIACVVLLIVTLIFGVGLAVAGANAPPPNPPPKFR